MPTANLKVGAKLMGISWKPWGGEGEGTGRWRWRWRRWVVGLEFSEGIGQGLEETRRKGDGRGGWWLGPRPRGRWHRKRVQVEGRGYAWV